MCCRVPCEVRRGARFAAEARQPLPGEAMSSRSVVSLVALGGAVAAGVALGHAQPLAAQNAAQFTSGQFEVVALPQVTAGEASWLVLDTRTGRIAHWTERRSSFTVHTDLAPGSTAVRHYTLQKQSDSTRR